MSTRVKSAGLAGAILIAATSVSGVFASSHREAPLISGDPNADNTDLYAFVSPDDPDSLTIIANYIPLQEPAGGPNFFPFDDTVRYEIHIDNNGDARPDASYDFRFSSQPKATNFAGIPTFLYNDGPITSLTDENWLAPQTYNVERNGTRIGSDLPTPPANIGPRSTPDYAALAAVAVNTLPDGTKVFAGQRDDAFFVDLGSIFDLAGLRPFNTLHAISLPDEAGVDGVGGFNTNSIALQIPLEQLTKDHALPSGPNDPDAVLGVWAAASRQKHLTLNGDGTVQASGKWVQVSRLGNPLINEVIIPRVAKDYWNSQTPAGDSQFAKYYLAPELAAVANVLYDALDTPATSGRADLVAVLLTGLNIPSSEIVPGGLQFTRTGNTQADMVRVNTGIKPNAAGACVFGSPDGGTPSRLGALEGDLCGFPNGRRLLDDVTDIELRAVVEGYGPTLNAVLGVPNRSPNNLIGDGVDANDMPFLAAFPYAGTPHTGYEHIHQHGLNPMP
ncbi:MAG: DUF4331 domain-containing protein [Candidatus Limnocylindrales bacterium]|nr:DUF4331 domain-containing protein [Candidatus Limnocylindrales bacterium]